MTTVATATVLGGFFPANGVSTLASMSGESGQRHLVSQALGTAKSQYAQRAIMVALMGVAPGATATKNFARIVASSELGGARPVENLVLVNRATTAADVAEMTNDYLSYTTRTTFAANPVANGDRNPLGTR